MCIGWCADYMTLGNARCNDKDTEIKFHEHLSSGSRVVPCGQTGRRTGRSRISYFCERF